METNLQSIRPRSLTDSELQRYIGIIENTTLEWQEEIAKRFDAEIADRYRSGLEDALTAAPLTHMRVDFNTPQ